MAIDNRILARLEELAYLATQGERRLGCPSDVFVNPEKSVIVKCADGSEKRILEAVFAGTESEARFAAAASPYNALMLILGVKLVEDGRDLPPRILEILAPMEKSAREACILPWRVITMEGGNPKSVVAERVDDHSSHSWEILRARDFGTVYDALFTAAADPLIILKMIEFIKSERK